MNVMVPCTEFSRLYRNDLLPTRPDGEKQQRLDILGVGRRPVVSVLDDWRDADCWQSRTEVVA